MLSGGTFSSQIGSWTCRSDGKLVVTLIWANYNPTNDAVNHPVVTPIPPPVDILLSGHTRATYLFSVTDANTLTRTQARNRQYDATQDPTDPTGGVLGPLATNVRVYKRLAASDGSACSLKARAFSGKRRLARAKLVNTVLPNCCDSLALHIAE